MFTNEVLINPADKDRLVELLAEADRILGMYPYSSRPASSVTAMSRAKSAVSEAFHDCKLLYSRSCNLPVVFYWVYSWEPNRFGSGHRKYNVDKAYTMEAALAALHWGRNTIVRVIVRNGVTQYDLYDTNTESFTSVDASFHDIANCKARE